MGGSALQSCQTCNMFKSKSHLLKTNVANLPHRVLPLSGPATLSRRTAVCILKNGSISQRLLLLSNTCLGGSHCGSHMKQILILHSECRIHIVNRQISPAVPSKIHPAVQSTSARRQGANFCVDRTNGAAAWSLYTIHIHILSNVPLSTAAIQEKTRRFFLFLVLSFRSFSWLFLAYLWSLQE